MQLDSNGDCKLCRDANLMKNGVCSSEGCGISHCSVCSNYFNEPQCELCKENFVVYPYANEDGNNKTRCIHENGRTVGCQVSSFEDERECLLCRVNFYFSEGKCIRSEDYEIVIEYEGYSSIYKYSLMVMLFLIS